MSMVHRKLKFFINSFSWHDSSNQQKPVLFSERAYSMPEEGWNLDSYIDLIDWIEQNMDCYLFEQQSKEILSFEISFPNNDRRGAEQRLGTLKAIMESIVTFFERMERLGAML